MGDYTELKQLQRHSAYNIVTKALEVGPALSVFHTPTQADHLSLFSHFVSYTSLHPSGNLPLYFTRMALGTSERLEKNSLFESTFRDKNPDHSQGITFTKCLNVQGT